MLLFIHQHQIFTQEDLSPPVLTLQSFLSWQSHFIDFKTRCISYKINAPMFSIRFMKVKVLVTQLCPTLCDPMDCCPPGSSVHEILQARTLEWVAIPFSGRSSNMSLKMRHLIGQSPPIATSSQRISFLHQTVSRKGEPRRQLRMETWVRSVAPRRMHLFCDQQNTLLYIQQNKNKVTPEIQEKAPKVADPIGNSGFPGPEAEIGWRNFSCIYFSSDNEKLFECHHTTKRLPSWLSSKESVYQCRRRMFDPWVRKIPWRRKRQLTPVLLLGKSHRQQRLAGDSPWDLKESNTTQQLNNNNKVQLKITFKSLDIVLSKVLL